MVTGAAVRGMAAFCALIGTLAPASQPIAAPAATAIGAIPAAVPYRDMSGGSHSLRKRADLPAVYLFLTTQCPVCDIYTPRVRALARKYEHRGVHVFGVFSSKLDTRASVIRYSRDRAYDFPLAKDDGRVAVALGATMTPEAVVLDRTGAIRYRGRIDDNQDTTRVTSHDLANALDAVLAGRTVARAETPAFGCYLEPVKAVRASSVVYTRDVAPILQSKCEPCHRPGEVAPFALQNYAQAVIWARQIRDFTQRRIMPPWKANSHGEFLNERRLSDSEIRTISRWVDAGAPEGDPKLLPPPPTFPSGWKLQKPDVILGAQKPYRVAADGADEYHCFVIPTHYGEDRYLDSVEVHPGNRAVVHHVIAYLDVSGRARELAAPNGGSDYTNPTPGSGPGFIPAGFLGGWAPGNEGAVLPPGVGNRLPKGADIVIEVHYHKNGKAETDQTQVGLHFCRGAVKKRLHIMPVLNMAFAIPAGDPDCVVSAAAPVRRNITVLSVMPHMHLTGKSMELTASIPGSADERELVDVPAWDFNWQSTYVYKQPVKLAAGSVIHLTAHYDNSSANPNNPHRPPQTLHWGGQTTDEMCLAFIAYTDDAEDLTQGRPTFDLFDLIAGRRRSTRSAAK